MHLGGVLGSEGHCEGAKGEEMEFVDRRKVQAKLQLW